jgi:glucose/mannose-6-phosphate isomerase
MLDLVDGLGSQLQASASIADAARDLPADGIDRLIVCGMGGSAAAADLIRGCYAQDPLELSVVRGYEVPGRMDENCLVVFSSYSGMTEETVAAYDAFARSGSPARSIVLSTWGLERAGPA